MGRPRLPPEQRRPRLSGAQRRKLDLEQARLLAARHGLELGRPAAHVPERHDGDTGWADEFKKAGKPDLANPETDLLYVRKLQLIALRQMATTPIPSQAQQALWRRIREMAVTLGMTSNKASLEAKVKALEGLLAERKQSGAIRVVPGSTIAKPPTARGQRPPGPRALPPEPVEEPAPLRPVDEQPEEPPTE